MARAIYENLMKAAQIEQWAGKFWVRALLVSIVFHVVIAVVVISQCG